VVDGPCCYVATRDRGGNSDPEDPREYRRDVDTPNAKIDRIHCDLHDANGNNLTNPHYFQGGFDPEALISHDWFNGQRYSDHKCEYNGQRDRPKYTNAKSDADDKSSNLANGTSGQAMKGRSCGGFPRSGVGLSF